MKRQEKDYRKKLLIGFIDYYLSKPDIKMTDLLTNLKNALSTKGRITRKQFEAIVRFIERERFFKGKSETEILDYFSPFIIGYRTKGVSNVSTANLYGL